MKIGGQAECLLQLKDLESVREDLPQPLRILGNGSNVLIDDRGLKGTVIVMRDFPPPEPEILEETADRVLVRASAGLFLPSLCRWAEKKSLSGCEYMIGVPGTVGGAVVQNAGANQQELKDILKSVQVFNLESRKVQELSAENCRLNYRTSRFKGQKDVIVVSADLWLKRSEGSTIEKQIQTNLDYRKQKTPYSKPSLGSIYTRIPLSTTEWLFPGKLIEDAGLKGTQIGGAQISPVHANYIVNEKNASFDDVLSLMEKIETSVQSKFNVQLHREIEVWTDRL